MNERERYMATLRFERPDRVPYDPGHGRESTLAAWHTQGLPPHVTDYHTYIRKSIGVSDEAVSHMDRVDYGVAFTMIPEFEEKIIEERANSRVVQDWKGNICEIGKEFTPRYLRWAPDFVTRTWIKCPVETREDWPDIARRYDPDDPQRWPDDFDARCRQLRDRDYLIGLGFPGPFWQLREWLGFENLCMLFLDDPAFVRDMIDLWRRFVATLLERIFAAEPPDYIMINEDMAYKQHAMISPDMCREFLSPTWRHWGSLCKNAGVFYEVDSDGFIEELVPVWLEAGIQSNSPVEVAAGNDLPAMRKRFDTRMAYRGGIDKRAIAAGGQTLCDEIARLKPVIDAGGYVPSCDHGVPADVAWPNFVEYCRQLA